MGSCQAFSRVGSAAFHRKGLSKMTSSNGDMANGLDKSLLVILAEINNSMMTIWKVLDSNPAIDVATRGCDVRRYQGSMMEREAYCFESYVEAETRTGEMFWWLLDITLTSSGWHLQRSVGKRS